jgi:Peptidase S24-like
MSVLEKNFLTLSDSASTARSTANAERSALVASVLRQGTSQTVRLRVHGESMLPSLWPGDTVEIAACSLDDMRPGDVALALRDGQFFLHRLISVCTSKGFILRGDSMPGPDAIFPPEALLGRLVRRDDEGLGFAKSIWSRAVGMLLCHCDVARRVVLKLHSRKATSAANLEAWIPRHD